MFRAVSAVWWCSIVAIAVLTPQGCPSFASTTGQFAVIVSGPIVFYALGETHSFRAVATMPDGSTVDETTAATWASSDRSVAVVSIAGRVTSASPGTATISATVDGVSASTTIHVNPPDWRFVGAPTLTQADPQVEFLAVDPRDEATIYVGTLKGVYVTRNGGGSWENPLPGIVTDLALDPRNPDRVYATTGTRALMRSVDRGTTFVLLKQFDDGVGTIRVSTYQPGALYIGYGGYQNPNPSGTFMSTDDGATWMRQPFGASGYLIPWDVAEDPANGNLYVGTEVADHPKPYHPQFFRSTDRGRTWTDATGILPWHVIHIAVNPTNHAVLALTEGSGLYTSTDAAQTWTVLDNHFALSLLLDPVDPTRVFGGDFSRGAFVSQDSGGTFQPFGLAGREVAALALNGSRTRLYAACYGSGIYVADLYTP